MRACEQRGLRHNNIKDTPDAPTLFLILQSVDVNAEMLCNARVAIVPELVSGSRLAYIRMFLALITAFD